MPWQLVVALVLSCFMQVLQNGAYAARIAGVRTGQIATAISLFSLVVTISRTANMFYAPMIGTLSDAAGAAVRKFGMVGAHAFEWQMRFIILSATIGAIIGSLLIPTFVILYVRGIHSFERRDSLLSASLRLFDLRTLIAVGRETYLPALTSLTRFSHSDVPVKLLIANAVLTAIYSVGVTAATYASVLDPNQARATLMLSSIVNGFGTIAMAFVVDPTSARIVDRAVKGQLEMRFERAVSSG